MMLNTLKPEAGPWAEVMGRLKVWHRVQDEPGADSGQTVWRFEVRMWEGGKWVVWPVTVFLGRN